MSNQTENNINQDYVEWQTSVRHKAYVTPDSSPPPSTGAMSLEQLFSKGGDEFIDLAYRTFLGRLPSEEERLQQRRELINGTAKSVLAARLRHCHEARNLAQHLGLKSAYWLDRIGQLPVIGPVARLLATLAASPGAKATLLSHDHQLHGIHDQLLQFKAVNRRVLRDVVSGEEQLKGAVTRTNLLVEELRQEIKSLRDRQQELDDQLRAARPGSAPARQESQGTPVDEGFYIAFEAHFRGSEEVIRQRLGYYLPILASALPPPDSESRAIDIGCGRGEWIGLLREQGYNVTGIDLNDRNIARCKEQGLNVAQVDGIQWLRQSESKSLRLISSFHVIEHLSLPQLNSLLIEALRCLEPGGVIILETPNPENLITAAHRFYTDPSHRNPLPPDLMEFFLKYQGFTDVQIHRLHPADAPEMMADQGPIPESVRQLLYGPQDYAVIARRPEI